MIDFIFKRRMFKIREVAFTSINEIDKKKCDVIYLHSREKEARPLGLKGFSNLQYTYVNNLIQPFENILKGINKNFRYEIRRAEKEGVINYIYTIDTQDYLKVINEFEESYNQMFQSKGMSLTFNRNMVLEGIGNGYIVITVGIAENYLNEKVFHAYLVDGKSAMLLYSCSPLWNDGDKEKANRIGRINKFLHFKDIEYFYSLGYADYEWGGIGNPEKPNGIDRFKSEFGGEIKSFYNYTLSNSLKGMLYVFLVKMRLK